MGEDQGNTTILGRASHVLHVLFHKLFVHDTTSDNNCGSRFDRRPTTSTCSLRTLQQTCTRTWWYGTRTRTVASR